MKTDRIQKTAYSGYAFLTAALLLGICSKSSPLYPMNDWVDVHCFLTMGKSLINGLVPYADLYEQKGPVLYFLYALVSLISDKSFWGVYLLEILSFGLFLLFSGKIVRLYTQSDLFAWGSLPLLGLGVVLSPAFSHGGSVEQMCLFMMAYGLYTVLKAVRNRQSLSFAEGLCNGIFAGMMLWIKFTMLGFYVGLCLFVVFWYLAWLRSFPKLLRLIGQFLLGVAAVSAIVLVYFVANHAVDDLFTAYFYNNIFLYPNDSQVSKLSQILYCLRWALFYNSSFSWMVMLGFVYLLCSCRRHLPQLLCVCLCFVGTVTLTYWGGKGIMDGYKYYDLVLAGFIMFAPVAIWKMLQLLVDGFRLPGLSQWLLSRRWTACVLTAALLLGISLPIAAKYGKNVYLMHYEKEDMPQYQFAQIISQAEQPTLLNYGFLDGGFYYAADVLPTCRYFCTFNVLTPDMWQEQNRFVEDGLVEFVVTRQHRLSAYGLDTSHYQLVDTAQMMFEGIDFTYYLYQRK